MLLCIEGTTPTDRAEKLSFRFKFLKSATFKGPDVKAGKLPEIKNLQAPLKITRLNILSVLLIKHLIPWQ